MAVTYEERKALLTELVLRLREQKTPVGSVIPIYQIEDAPNEDRSMDSYPYIGVLNSSVRIRVHPLLTDWRTRWSDAHQQIDGFEVLADRSYSGPRRLNRVVKKKTKDTPKSLHTSVVKYLTSVREDNARRDRQREAAKESRRVAKARVEALAALLMEAGFAVQGFFDDPRPYIVVYFAKDVHIMIEPYGTQAGMGFAGKTRELEVPETMPKAVEYMTLVRDFFVGIAALKGK